MKLMNKIISKKFVETFKYISRTREKVKQNKNEFIVFF
jgi:hypothetical protein